MSRTKKVRLCDAKQIKNTEEGKEVILLFDNGDEYSGIFKRVDDEQIILKSLISDHVIGLPLSQLKYFLEVLNEH